MDGNINSIKESLREYAEQMSNRIRFKTTVTEIISRDFPGIETEEQLEGFLDALRIYWRFVDYA